MSGELQGELGIGRRGKLGKQKAVRGVHSQSDGYGRAHTRQTESSKFDEIIHNMLLVTILPIYVLR